MPFHGLIVVLLCAGGCTTQSADCPECPAPVSLDAAVTCSPTPVACSDAGIAIEAETCTYVNDSARGYVRALGRAIACDRPADGCTAPLRQLRIDLCTSYVDPCRAAPCRNQGACTATATGFACRCPSGFTGASCETDVDECPGAPCGSGFQCFNTLGSFVCRCPGGYAGSDCTADVDECAQAPCLNGGTCVNEPGSFRCACPPGFAGPLCATDRRFCTGTPLACSARTSQCTAGAGCSAGACVGSRSCWWLGTRESCAWAGCSYSNVTGCYGSPISCDANTTSSSCDAASCTWSLDTCVGSAAPCSSLTLASCTPATGCSIGVPP